MGRERRGEKEGKEQTKHRDRDSVTLRSSKILQNIDRLFGLYNRGLRTDHSDPHSVKATIVSVKNLNKN